MKAKHWLQIGFHMIISGLVLARWFFRVNAKSSPGQKDGLVVGYVRQSLTRLLDKRNDHDQENADTHYDMNSPDRQRSNILAAAKKYGLAKPRIFQDTKGHKSGSNVANRPEWQKIEKLIVARKVSVLLLNDLSRAHRKGWRIGQMIEWLETYHVRLILAAPDREVDLNSIMGKMLLLFIGMIDEYYVTDASLRQKDNIAAKRKQGKTIAMPPFGSIRKDGYLTLTQRGAWLLADGRHVGGLQGEPPPEEDAIWRGYGDCLRHVFELYTQRNRLGYHRIAFQLNLEGWAFRDRHHEPRSFRGEDVRRMIAQWPLYAGIVLGGKATIRKAQDNLRLIETAPAGRNIVSLSLLRRVAQVQEERSLRRRGDGSVTKSFPYLRDLYCAHCERKAIAMRNPKWRRRLSGTKNSYRHPQDTPCSCHTRSVPVEVVNEAIGDLLESFTFRDDTLSMMRELAASVESVRITHYEDLEARRRVALRKATQRLRNDEALYRDGEIDQAEYDTRHRKIAHKIADLKTQAKHLKSTTIPLSQGVEEISDLAHLWHAASDMEKRVLGKLVFDSIIFDLDERRIAVYTLKPWLLVLIIPPINLID